jgi:hypothetical protein
MTDGLYLLVAHVAHITYISALLIVHTYPPTRPFSDGLDLLVTHTHPPTPPFWQWLLTFEGWLRTRLQLLLLQLLQLLLVTTTTTTTTTYYYYHHITTSTNTTVIKCQKVTNTIISLSVTYRRGVLPTYIIPIHPATLIFNGTCPTSVVPSEHFYIQQCSVVSV